MVNEEKVFIIGHKNPDTDSICSAIAYADIKKRTTHKKEYIPARAGHISEETDFVLKKFGIKVPQFISNIGTQVKDMEIHITPEADRNMTLKNAWDLMRANNIITLPVLDKEGSLEGLITIGDIAETYMGSTDSYLLSRAKTQYKKIAETINGRIMEGDENGYFDKGKVVIGTFNPSILAKYLHQGDLVILGDRREDQLQAIEQNVSCMIIGLDSGLSEEVRAKAREKGIVLIGTSIDTFTISRLINQSIPIGYLMKTTDLDTFSTEDYTDDIQDIMIRKRHRSFPVITKDGKCIGTISRRNFLGMHKKKVILVDHNERDQAVNNIEKAEIMEILDHHKLGSLETMAPIAFRNEPVGCTATIIYQMYGEQKLEIAPDIAGILCAAIISDTLMFRSPTCTIQDKMAAGALALIADINIESFAKEMFRAGSNLKDKTPEAMFYQDFKKFVGEGGLAFGVGQISSMDEEELMEIKERLVPFIETEVDKIAGGRVFFMLTNIIDKSTELLYYGEGSREIAEAAFHVKPKDGMFYLKDVVSRKKQLIPALMDAVQSMENQL